MRIGLGLGLGARKFGAHVLRAWILLAGTWSDSGAWQDNQTWNDGV